ncbi:MAG: bifunctional glutamate N-acetyltransferase/amino-acid acetyltransferase ArgJ [Desulfovibrio sp.]|jgi:glutamate N-acetyltransferase/amino-acid N-acetyltransferase|nr:bifunctional glutamate N-acetyltransferase/amino-acid acetyltransferase ArgJ [Desulfovibrio sp.]
MNDDLPKGFRAGTAQANFKKAGRDDLGLLVSDSPCVLSGLFTQNAFKAAPVVICQEIARRGKPVRAVLANSGQANACTGDKGLENCRETQAMLSANTGLSPDEILPISTGVIGRHLLMERWAAAVPALVRSLGARDAEAFTRAIMTTDAFPKFASRDLELSAGRVRLTVMAKGAGMICPNMATMLCVALTDALVERQCWQAMFRAAAGKTFNRVSVDGDTSTNDTILGLANGVAGVSVASGPDHELFENALTDILGKVAYMLVQDGEGASKVIHITVSGARDDADAERAARSVGHSQLVKTAVYGGDANWGRIITAVGYSGADFEPGRVSLTLCGVECFSCGQPVNEDKEEVLALLLREKDIHVAISLGDGPGQYVFLASDLGHEYVSLNADYRS